VKSSQGVAPLPLVPGLLAGLTGAVLIDAYLLLTIVVIAHGATVAGFYQFVASSVIGGRAYGDPTAIWLGVVLHVAVSVAWGIGFAFAAAGTPQVAARPVTSGIVFGIVVMLAMQLVEVAANVYVLPNTFVLLNAFVAHTVFFGIPVAFVATKRLAHR
jgi:hypothetical protein